MSESDALEKTIDRLSYINIFLAVAIPIITFLIFYYSNKLEKAKGMHRNPHKRNKKTWEWINIGMSALVALMTVVLFALNQTLSSQKESAANLKIQEAKTKADSARAVAANAIHKTEELRNSLSDTRLEQENKRKELEIRLANAETERLNAQRENAKLQMALQQSVKSLVEFQKDRKFTDFQRQVFNSCLTTYPIPTGLTFVVSVMHDPEAKTYATDLKKFLKVANWPLVNDNKGADYSNMPAKGIYICVDNPTAPPEHATHLKQILNEMGISSRIIHIKKIKNTDIMVLVGAKQEYN
ncbi:hypothetical protein IC229_04225 [Spirosoma sp. BT702]|uniref:Uncharacterized protein n=1 Tax=Spirosoma profusum TaxID=2771354 RepID=A0A926XT94_9BACT|nr:hypothetical protein [Spirosoma profusum]MBD2699829.1 hypothetical protein [Spirosoma profusum]